MFLTLLVLSHMVRFYIVTINKSVLRYYNILSMQDLFNCAKEHVFNKAFYTIDCRPENVAAAIIQMLEKGAEGAVWVSQNDEPPFAVKEGEHYEQLRVPID